MEVIENDVSGGCSLTCSPFHTVSYCESPSSPCSVTSSLIESSTSSSSSSASSTTSSGHLIPPTRPTSSCHPRNVKGSQSTVNSKLEVNTSTISLHPLNHQVGGHTQLMLLDEWTVCKPLIQRELLFYLNIPPELKAFVPLYKGVVQVRQVDGCPIIYHPIRGTKVKCGATKEPSSLRDNSLKVSHSQPEIRVQLSSCNDKRLLQKDLSHESSRTPCSTSTNKDYGYSSRPSQRYFLLMENIASRYQLPCILDLKMGTRQHGDDASAEKRKRQMAKCAATTSATLGVRLGGMQVFRHDLGCYAGKDKYYGRKLKEDGFREAMVDFFRNGFTLRTSVMQKVLNKLKCMKDSIEKQSSFRFYSTSLLIMYDGAIDHRHLMHPLQGAALSSVTVAELDHEDDDDHDSDDDDSNSNDCPYDEAARFYTKPRRNSNPVSPKKRYNSHTSNSSGDDEDSSLENSIDFNESFSKSYATGSRYKQQRSNIGDQTRRFLFPKSATSSSTTSSSTSSGSSSKGPSSVVPSSSPGPQVDVRMIDFAHTVLASNVRSEQVVLSSVGSEVHEGPDKGFLKGINSLIRILSQVLSLGDRTSDEEHDVDHEDMDFEYEHSAEDLHPLE